jgi:hypothetical protein
LIFDAPSLLKQYNKKNKGTLKKKDVAFSLPSFSQQAQQLNSGMWINPVNQGINHWSI